MDKNFIRFSSLTIQQLMILPDDKDGGYVYVVQFGECVKIGSSQHPIRRLKELNYGLVYQSKDIVVLISNLHETYRQTEHLLHQLFSENRVPTTELFVMNYETVLKKLQTIPVRYFNCEPYRKDCNLNQRIDALIEMVNPNLLRIQKAAFMSKLCYSFLQTRPDVFNTFLFWSHHVLEDQCWKEKNKQSPTSSLMYIPFEYGFTNLSRQNKISNWKEIFYNKNVMMSTESIAKTFGFNQFIWKQILQEFHYGEIYDNQILPDLEIISQCCTQIIETENQFFVFWNYDCRQSFLQLIIEEKTRFIGLQQNPCFDLQKITIREGIGI